MDRTQSLDFEVQQQVTLETLSSGVVKSSAIEGETLWSARVHSSLAWRLGIHPDDAVEGIVHLTPDSTQRYGQALTGERLLE